MEMSVTFSSTTFRSIPKLSHPSQSSHILPFCFCSCFSAPLPPSTEAYDSHDPNGNITIKWDIKDWTGDGYSIYPLSRK